MSGISINLERNKNDGYNDREGVKVACTVTPQLFFFEAFLSSRTIPTFGEWVFLKDVEVRWLGSFGRR